MIAPPTKVRASTADGVFEIGWPDGNEYRLPFKFLRYHCPCAGCVDEFTGIRRIEFDSIPDDITPMELSPVGNYALKIRWSDKHDTGLFTWEYLTELCQSVGNANV